ncbi:hypothetical protein [uncultured Brevundimonas sp.]|uniref:hypothetical protein n=1 Tax=uncultured Brevundimonas sp. TaxID=213418 RepID=UPI0030EECDAE|tara:strand:- start:5167 stop:5466 length:300 start_codon:yes stop_codon:yes gene_type:complete
MKLMGAPKLFAAAAGASLAARGACAALCAELEAGDWACVDDVTSSFPRAGWSKNRAVIAVDDALDAVVAFNFERGIALIDTVQPAKASTPAAARRRRSA